MVTVTVKNFFVELQRVHYGLETYKELFLHCIDKALGNRTSFFEREYVRKRLNPDEISYRIKDIRLPFLNGIEEKRVLFMSVFEDTFWSYVNCNDNYDEKTFDECDKFLGEGLYGLVNDKVNVTVNPGDIVIDAGAWIGDFSAYASVKGAMAYAFEPTRKTFAYLEETARLNGNIIPVKKGLSDENISLSISVNGTGSSIISVLDNQDTEKIEVVRLDDFVRENKLERVDFIKADIEGSERLMLAGAQETLRRFAPKLALCTYHLPDDPQVMAELILKANPKYNIVQKRKKLFASVPD